jgi:hypothetical protein
VSERKRHTRGPWESLRPGRGRGTDPSEYGCSIRSVTDDKADWICGDVYVRADARLIAAAPDLLKALKRVNREAARDEPAMWAEVTAAIAKAGGR